MNSAALPFKTSERALVFTAALILAAIVIGSGSASGQGFNCRTAADEMTLCHEPGLTKLDQDLATLRRLRHKATRDEVSRRAPSGDRDDLVEHTLPAQANCGSRNAMTPPAAQRKPPSNISSPPVGKGRSSLDGSSRTANRSKEQIGLGTHIRHELRAQVNSGLVTILLSGLDSGDLSDATDLVTILKDAHLKILPVAGEAAAKAVTDLLFARGIDIAIVQTDVLASLKRQAPFPGIENFLQYVSKLYDAEVHILAGRDFHTLEDLASKPVNFGPLDSGTFLTASAIFGTLGIGVEITTFPQTLALDKLRRGEIAALVYTAAKPARLFQDIKPEEGLHFLSVSDPEALRERYGQVTLSAADYPDLVEQDKPISTLSVGTVMAVYNWPEGTERYRNVAHFVDTFFGRLAELRMSRHHPKWREVDIHASVGGWTRFAAASQWIKSAERSPNEPTRIAGRPVPMEGSTSPPVQLNIDSGEIEPSIADPTFNHPKSGPPDSSSQEQRAQEGDWVSVKAEQLDALFKDFVEYTKRDAQRKESITNDNEALFAEFQTYVKLGLQRPNRQHTDPRAEPSAAVARGNQPRP